MNILFQIVSYLQLKKESQFFLQLPNMALSDYITM